MLTEFSIGNYQAFSTPQRVPLKPITLIFGPNSAGKSALLRSLLVTRHAILNGKLSKSEGAHVLHPGQVSEYARNKKGISLSLKVLGGGGELDLKESITFSANLHEQEGNLACEVVEWSGSDKPLLHSTWNRRSKVLVPEFVADELLPSDEEISVAQIKTGQAVEDMVKTWLSDSDRGLPSKNSFAELTSNDMRSPILNSLKEILANENRLDEDVLIKLREAVERISGLEKLAGARARAQMNNIAAAFHDAISRDLRNMAYHEPLRPVPKHIERADKDDPVLCEWWRLASDPDLLERINRWFASNPHTKHHRLIFDRLLPVSKYSNLVAQLGGEITANQALEAALDAKIESEGLCEEHIYQNGLWNDLDPSVCDFETKEEALSASYHYLMDDGNDGWKHFNELAESGDLDAALDFMLSGVNALKKTYASTFEAPWKHLVRADIYFEDVATKVKVPPSNLGVGFSQMIPFVSSALSSENRLIAIEQPELHVHPALQTELADLFIQSAKERGNRFLIETHSEHLILRILRRIRETNDNTLPEGKTSLRPEDVAVLYVQPGENGSEVIELPVTVDGDFAAPWPGGFFAERSAELF